MLVLAGAGAQQLATITLGADYEVFSWDKPPTIAGVTGRTVTLWGPSRDETATLAGRYLKLAAALSVVESEAGFNAILQDRHTGDAVHDFIRSNSQLLTPPSKALKRNGNGHHSSAAVSWHTLGLECNHRGIPYPTVTNAAKVLLSALNVWFDDFRGKGRLRRQSRRASVDRRGRSVHA